MPEKQHPRYVIQNIQSPDLFWYEHYHIKNSYWTTFDKATVFSNYDKDKDPNLEYVLNGKWRKVEITLKDE